MAKEIKAIKCPQCGSGNKTEVKPELYRCNDFQATSFLVNDDFNINYNHHQSTPDYKKIKLVIFGLILAAAVFVPMVIGNLNSGKAVSIAIDTPKNEPPSNNSESYESNVFLKPSTQEPIVAIVEERHYSTNADKDKDGTYQISNF